jgi:carnitine 3-dehydrogenase
LSDFRYGQLFGDAMDVLYREVGVDDAYRRDGHMFYTVESHVRHLAEAKVGQTLEVSTQILSVDDKRLHVFHRVLRPGIGAGVAPTLIATGEQMHVHVDTAAAKAAPILGTVRAKLDSLARAQAGLAVPAEAGRSIGQARR